MTITNPCPALFVLAGSLVLSLMLAVPSRAEEPGKTSVTVFVGTYTGKESRGIYRFEFDEATGKVGEASLAAELKNPAFLAIAPGGRFLYAVSEVDSLDGQKGARCPGSPSSRKPPSSRP